MTLRALTVRGIPEGVLKALRAAAKRNRRSLNAEVLVRLETAVAEAAPRDAGGGSVSSARRAYDPGRLARGAGVVRDPEGQPYEVQKAFQEADRARLLSDLALTPEARVRLAEELSRAVPDGTPRPRFRRVIQFDRYEDYLDWRALEGRRP